MTPGQQDLDNAYSILLGDLNQAYWAADSMDVKDQLYGIIEIVTSLITQLVATDLETRNAAYDALLARVGTVNKELKTLQEQINSLINRISTAAAIVSDIAKVLSVAATVFPAA
jgi:allophanate hydrolase subunit 1